jgi:uncharacterized SAM-binding protein YcdF (DUF218 family)
MFFILSKILTYLIMPLTIVFVLLTLSIVLRNPRWKKRTLLAGFLLMYFFSNDFVANEVMGAWELPATPYSNMKKYKVGIVLTGTTISGLQPADRVYSHRGADRVIHTVQLYKLGLIEKIIISGGTGRILENDDPEADKYKALMLTMGVSEDAIILENKTRNTAESATAVKNILEKLEYNTQDCVLITSAFHMRRSLACYQKVGLSMDYFTVDFYAHPRSFYPDSLFLPQYEAINIWGKLFKEWIGMMAYKAAGYI